MSEPFLGEIRMFPGNFAPRGWALCNGQLLAISQNTALFSLLGTSYGGNGTQTFALPNLQGSTPMHWGNGPGLTPRVLGETGGEQSVTLLSTQMGAHSHPVTGVQGAGNEATPAGNSWAEMGRATHLYSASLVTAMSPQATSAAGGNQPHNNMPPYLCLNFIIALQGVFPARN